MCPILSSSSYSVTEPTTWIVLPLEFVQFSERNMAQELEVLTCNFQALLTLHSKSCSLSPLFPLLNAILITHTGRVFIFYGKHCAHTCFLRPKFFSSKTPEQKQGLKVLQLLHEERLHLRLFKNSSSRDEFTSTAFSRGNSRRNSSWTWRQHL